MKGVKFIQGGGVILFLGGGNLSRLSGPSSRTYPPTPSKSLSIYLFFNVQPSLYNKSITVHCTPVIVLQV